MTGRELERPPGCRKLEGDEVKREKGEAAREGKGKKEKSGRGREREKVCARM